MLGQRLIKLFLMMHVFLYRLSGGALGGHFRGLPVLLLMSAGRKTGKRRAVPLLYISDGANYVIIASNGGRDRNPGWWLNLQSNPQTTIEVGTDKISVVSEQATQEEKKLLWEKLVAKARFYGDYQKRTKREIPIVILHPVV